jgi:hypothetical protein
LSPKAAAAAVQAPYKENIPRETYPRPAAAAAPDLIAGRDNRNYVLTDFSVAHSYSAKEAKKTYLFLRTPSLIF